MESPLEIFVVFPHTFLIMQLEAAGSRGCWSWRSVTEEVFEFDVTPDGMMVAREVFHFKVATAERLKASSPPNSVYCTNCGSAFARA